MFYLIALFSVPRMCSSNMASSTRNFFFSDIDGHSISHLVTNIPFLALTVLKMRLYKPFLGLCHSNLGQLKCVKLPGILGAILAMIIEYINSVHTPLLYHRGISPHIIYMRSFEYLLQVLSTLSLPYSLKCYLHVIFSDKWLQYLVTLSLVVIQC